MEGANWGILVPIIGLLVVTFSSEPKSVRVQVFGLVLILWGILPLLRYPQFSWRVEGVILGLGVLPWFYSAVRGVIGLIRSKSDDSGLIGTGVAGLAVSAVLIQVIYR